MYKYAFSLPTCEEISPFPPAQEPSHHNPCICDLKTILLKMNMKTMHRYQLVQNAAMHLHGPGHDGHNRPCSRPSTSFQSVSDGNLRPHFQSSQAINGSSHSYRRDPVSIQELSRQFHLSGTMQMTKSNPKCVRTKDYAFLVMLSSHRMNFQRSLETVILD